MTPLTLDVTDASQIQSAVEKLDTLDILINNAGIAIYDDLNNFEVIEKHLAVNTLGLLKVTNAFVPLLTRSKGAILNNVSLAGLAALPIIPAYSISKAAAFNLTQSLRALLGGPGRVRPRRRARARRYRYEPRVQHTEGFAGVGGAGHLRWAGKRRGRDFPRSRIAVHRRRLACRSAQRTRAAVRCFRTGKRGESCVTSTT